jgi:hypothetical protein
MLRWYGAWLDWNGSADSLESQQIRQRGKLLAPQQWRGLTQRLLADKEIMQGLFLFGVTAHRNVVVVWSLISESEVCGTDVARLLRFWLVYGVYLKLMSKSQKTVDEKGKVQI